MNLHDRQIELEEQYSAMSIRKGQDLVNTAFTQGRAADVGEIQVLLIKTYDDVMRDLSAFLAQPHRGLNGKYAGLLRRVPVNLLTTMGLRQIIQACANPEPVSMQSLLNQLGKAIETECLITTMQEVSQQYVNRTEEYLDEAKVHSISHIHRTYTRGAERLGIEWETWSADERNGVARLLCSVIYDTTGLFKWVQSGFYGDFGMYFIEPTPELQKVLEGVVSSARAMVMYPPMLCKPTPWTSQYNGGYCTQWFQGHASMCTIGTLNRADRKWVLEQLELPAADTVRAAMNKAQSVPYKVNTKVLDVLGKAVATRLGILGLPSFQEQTRPEFPFDEATFDKAALNAQEQAVFDFWRRSMRNWYTSEIKRKGRTYAILGRLAELRKFSAESALYFPTFIDWRGRMYFRSTLNPQSSDAVKGCLDFATAKPLGKDGLFWLKVHVANCAGYDKHTAVLKAKWTEENWEHIQEFLDDPLNIDAPEPDTAFTLLQAGYALQEALESPNPEEYLCSVPVAMDATCSGLQHFSAMLRDEVGGLYTNLIPNHADKKSDIYMQVASIADSVKLTLTDDVNIQEYWKARPITRSMSKRPVMTYVYGSTLQSSMDYVHDALIDAGEEEIVDENGKTLYTLHKLSVCVGKALRYAVEQSVPAAASGMKALRSAVRTHRGTALRWITPVGVPVINWSEKLELTQLRIRSMGVQAIMFKKRTREYAPNTAANGISPNFVHSLDSAHLCLTINAYQGDILPIHDSFGTHPCDVPELHRTLRETFIQMYSKDVFKELFEYNGLPTDNLPQYGKLDLNVVLESEFMFC